MNLISFYLFILIQPFSHGVYLFIFSTKPKEFFNIKTGPGTIYNVWIINPMAAVLVLLLLLFVFDINVMTYFFSFIYRTDRRIYRYIIIIGRAYTIYIYNKYIGIVPGIHVIATYLLINSLYYNIHTMFMSILNKLCWYLYFRNNGLAIFFFNMLISIE